MKGSEFIARRLAHWGIDTCFAVTGGGAMHLNDSFGAEPGIAVHYMHHEQACAIAAEGYARLAGRPAVLNVTSGPGAINALNGVFGAFTDSIPMVVVAGQVRRDTIAPLAGFPALRQLGDQEARLVEMVAPITVSAELVSDPALLPLQLDRAVLAACSGRPGPAWLDVPVDVQGADLPDADPFAPLPSPPPPPALDAAVYAQVLARLAAARRPLILAGTGIRAAGVTESLVPLAEALGVPVATGWTHDTIPSDHPLFAGRPGTIGTRAGNFIAQNADLVLVLGSRLNIRQVSYNWREFAPQATLIWVDVDEAELRKPYLIPALPIHADLREFVPGYSPPRPQVRRPPTLPGAPGARRSAHATSLGATTTLAGRGESTPTISSRRSTGSSTGGMSSRAVTQPRRSCPSSCCAWRRVSGSSATAGAPRWDTTFPPPSGPRWLCPRGRSSVWPATVR